MEIIIRSVHGTIISNNVSSKPILFGIYIR